MNARTALIFGMLVFFGIASRMLSYADPALANFTAIGAIALCGTALLQNKKLAYLLPLTAMVLGDIILHLTTPWASFNIVTPVIYACFLLTVVLGRFAEKPSVAKIGGLAVASSVIFFILTNAAVWAGFNYYPMTLEGLATCYASAIPFGLRQLAGELFYSAVLLGAVHYADTKLPQLQSQPTIA